MLLLRLIHLLQMLGSKFDRFLRFGRRTKDTLLHICFQFSLFPRWNGLQIESKAFIFSLTQLSLTIFHYSNDALLLRWVELTDKCTEIIALFIVHRAITTLHWDVSLDVFCRH